MDIKVCGDMGISLLDLWRLEGYYGDDEDERGLFGGYWEVWV
jgi:hypothetical protein